MNRLVHVLAGRRICPAFLVLGLLITGIAASAQPAKAPAHFRTLYLIRHGAYDQQTPGDDHVVNGLTPLGIAQARLAGARLRGMPVTFDALIASTLTRARQTAQVIHESFPTLPLRFDPDLCECQPESRSAKLNASVTPQEIQASEAQLAKAFATYFVPASDHDERDIVVCHANVIRWFVCKALGVDTKAWIEMSLNHCSLTIIQVTPQGAFRLLAVGDSGHIPLNLQTSTNGTPTELVLPAAKP